MSKKKRMHIYYRDQFVSAVLAAGPVTAICGAIDNPTRESVLDNNPGCTKCQVAAVEGKGSETVYLLETWADMLEAEYLDLKRRTSVASVFPLGTTSGWEWVS